MKSVFDMNGTERAAALLVALGPEIAADIIRNLDEESVEKITAEMTKINSLTPEDREDLVGEFIITLRKNNSNLKGGENRAKKILTDAFGKEKADSVLKKFEGQNVEKAFDSINKIDDDILLEFIKNEPPHIIALVMMNLVSDKSGRLLKSLPRDLAKDVAIRMAKMKKVSPETIVSVAKALDQKYKNYIKKQDGLATSGGIESLMGILEQMSGSDEQRLLKELDSFAPKVSKKIKEKIFSFENIVNLSNQEVRILIDEVADDDIIAIALKGAGDEIRFKILRNMSKNRATDIIKEMKAMGPIKLTDVLEKRGEIISVLRTLHDNGVVYMGKDKEQWVE